MGNTLKNMPKLQVLVLSIGDENRIGSESMTAISEGIRSLKKLQTLFLGFGSKNNLKGADW